MSSPSMVSGSVHNIFTPVSTKDFYKARRKAVGAAQGEHGNVQTKTFKRTSGFLGFGVKTEAVNPAELTNKDLRKGDVVTRIENKSGQTVGAAQTSQKQMHDVKFAVVKSASEQSAPVLSEKPSKLSTNFESSSLINMVQAISPVQDSANDAVYDVSASQSVASEKPSTGEVFSFTGSASTVAGLFDGPDDDGANDVFSALRAVVPVEFKRAASNEGKGLSGVTGRGVATGQAAVTFATETGVREDVRRARSLRAESDRTRVTQSLNKQHESTHTVATLDLAA